MNENSILHHHEQLSLCTSRLPYRQGRKLTAVKVYTVTDESKHLLVFGVPSLNIRQETKNLFMKFGKLKQFTLFTRYQNEEFTETYHVVYDRIQSARIAKKFLDTKNFYGGSLHVCYAPDLETVDEVREKLSLRKVEVLRRLRINNLDQINCEEKDVKPLEELRMKPKSTVNMGETNLIEVDKTTKSYNLKRNISSSNDLVVKQFKPCFIEKQFKPNFTFSMENCKAGLSSTSIDNNDVGAEGNIYNKVPDKHKNVELNFDNFGNEVIKKIQKPMNKITFFVNNKSTLGN